ncbi:hypothetical protein Micbo1qcDRAFT_235456 [Microdochium bolleyi]|uniref:Uncharacterized protein n=1 Tax=Microdochium bolleyi TaxID=196109 RepID=A0A136IWG6_9PEZI|nr:hypothetical protein Micbo1qcDRAFT_235456 [Microdochium bolleyi]
MLLQILLGLFCLSQSVSAQKNIPFNPSNYFIWPPLPGPPANVDPSVFADNPVLEYGKPQSRAFTFATSMNATTIYMFQEENPQVAKYHLIRDCVKTSYTNNNTVLHY